MEEIANRIYRGENIEIDDIRPMAAALGLSSGADLTWGDVHAQLCLLYRLPPQMPPQQTQLFLAFAFTNRNMAPRNKTPPRVPGQPIGDVEGQTCPEKWTAQSPLDKTSCKPEAVETGCNDPKGELALLYSELSSLKRKNQLLEDELEALRNECVDKEYENGFFVEDDVFKRIEEENCRLKNLSENIYGDLARVWFKLVEDSIKGSDE